MVATAVYAGGVDPKEMTHQEPVVREKVLATPEQTSAAVSKARRAVAPRVEPTPVVKEVPMPSPRPKAVAPASKESWLLSAGEGDQEMVLVLNDMRIVNMSTADQVE